MIDLDQLVETSWTPFNTKHFKELGYEYEYRGKLNVKARELTDGSGVIVKAICDYCGAEVNVQYGQYIISTKHFVERYACSSCKSRKAHEKTYDSKIYYERYLSACKEKGFEPLTQYEEFTTCRDTTVSIRCQKHGIQTGTYYYIVNGIGCKECSKEINPTWNKYTQDDVKKIMNEKNLEWVNYGQYISRDVNNLNVICPLCKSIYTTSLASIMINTGGCRDCANLLRGDNLRLSIQNVTDRVELSGNNILLNPNEYASNSTLNLDIMCKCGNVFTTSLVNFEKGKNRCDVCTLNKSSGEQLVEDILNKMHIEYDSEHIFPDCKDKSYLPFDFYIQDYNSCIEFDGQQHYEPVFGEQSFQLTQKHDKIKNEYCQKNNILLLRIPFWESSNAENIISNFLHLTKHPKIIKYHNNPYNNKS